MKNILVTAYTSFNVGDDLFLKILFERYPNHQFILFTSETRYISHLKQYENVKVDYFSKNENLFFRIAKKIFSAQCYLTAFVYKILIKWKYGNKCDAYLEIGGSIFIQKSKNLSFKEYKNKCIVSIFKHKPLFIIGANWGPYKTPKFKIFYTNLFRNFTDVCFRDKTSYSFFSDLPNVRSECDIVFQLELPKVQKEIGSIGFSVINLTERDDLSEYEPIYIKTISSLITTSLFRGKNVYLISFCCSEGDELMIEKIKSCLSNYEKSRINTLLYKGNLESFLIEYTRIESIVATRFHAMILSLISKQKLYPLIYSQKMFNVIQDIQFKGYYCQIKELSQKSPDDIFNQIEENKIFLLNNEKKSAEKHFFNLDKFLNHDQ